MYRGASDSSPAPVESLLSSVRFLSRDMGPCWEIQGDRRWVLPLGRHFLFLVVGTGMDMTSPCRGTTPQLLSGLS